MAHDRARTALKSTNVRSWIRREGAVPLLAWVLWAAVVAGLAASGALELLHEDVALLSAFAALFALLAYGVDREVRTAIDRRAGLAALVLAGSAAWLGTGDSAAMLMGAPLAVVSAAALLRRAGSPRLSSTPGRSPGARRAAP